MKKDQLKHEAEDILNILNRLQENLLKQEHQNKELEANNQSLKKELDKQDNQLKEMEKWLQEDVSFFVQPMIQNIIAKITQDLEEQFNFLKSKIEELLSQKMQSNQAINTNLEKIIANANTKDNNKNIERNQEILKSIEKLNTKLDEHIKLRQEPKKQIADEKKPAPIQIKDEDKWFYNSLTTPKQVKDMISQQSPYKPKQTSKNKKRHITGRNPYKPSHNETFNEQTNENRQENLAETSQTSKHDLLQNKQLNEKTKENSEENKSTNPEEEEKYNEASQSNESNESSNSFLSFLKRFSQ